MTPVSVVQTAMLQGSDVKKSLEMYQDIPKAADKKEFEDKKESDKSNKYSVMYGNTENIYIEGK